MPIAFLDVFSPGTLLFLAVLAVLLYGERLPEVARSFGKQFVEFKKSMQQVRQEFEQAASEVTTTVNRPAHKEDTIDREEATAPKFEVPPAEPAPETQTQAETH